MRDCLLSAVLGLSLICPAKPDYSYGSIQHPLTPPKLDTASPPQSWEHLGCYIDNPAKRVLSLQVFVDEAMTVNSCMDRCSQLGYNYAGLDSRHECYCDYRMNLGAQRARESDCNKPCAGTPQEECGGAQHLSIYTHRRNIRIVKGWIPKGCYPDNIPNKRTLSGKIVDNVKGTVEECIRLCRLFAFSLAGVESGNQCFCGSRINNNVTPISPSRCNLNRCPGNQNETCGGPGALDVFQAPVCTAFNSAHSLNVNLSGGFHHWETSTSVDVNTRASNLTCTGCPSIFFQPIKAGLPGVGTTVTIVHPVGEGLIAGQKYNFVFYQGRSTSPALAFDLGDATLGAALGYPMVVIELDKHKACSGRDCPMTTSDGSVWQQVSGSFVYAGETTIMIRASWGSDTQGLLLTGFTISRLTESL